MADPINIYGAGCNWNAEEVLFYKNRLSEVGFFVKIMYIKNYHFVFYSYRDFTKEEALEVLNSKFGGKI